MQRGTMICLRSSLVLVVLLVARGSGGGVSAFVQQPSSSCSRRQGGVRVRSLSSTPLSTSKEPQQAPPDNDPDITLDADNPVTPFKDDDNLDDDDDLESTSLDGNELIAHLQKKLRYWKQEHVAQEAAYKHYCLEQIVQHKLKPIYKRKGKIDTYQRAPVYDKETERMQTEIWSIKERIKLTMAKLREEERVQQMQQQTDVNLARFEQVAAEADEYRQREAQLAQELRETKREQELARQEAEATMARLEEEYTASIEKVRAEATQRLTEKETEIDTLRSDMRGLISNLHEKRQELGAKNAQVASLETQLQEKEAILQSLRQERASLRALSKQSYRVLKTRVKKRLGRGNEPAQEKTMEGDVKELLGSTKQEEAANGVTEKEKVTVGRRGGGRRGF